MMKASNQGTVKDGAWLVTPPEGINFTTALTIACRGNEKIANLLNYFLDVAAREAKRQSLDIEKIEYIEINRTLDQIIAALSSHNKAACKKTIHDRMLNLTSLKYIEADSYRYTYRVYFRAIQEAFNNPPPADKPKLRGRHARKEQSQEACQDRNFDLKVKSSIRAENDKNRIAILENEISDLRSRMLDLTSEISDLRSRMLDLTSSLDQERACREALEAKNSSLYISNTGVNTGSNTVGTYGANAPVVNDAHTPDSLFSEKELPPMETTEPPVSPNGKNPTKPERPAGKETNKGKGKRNVTVTEPPEKPKTGLDAHTEQEKAFWALWLNADQNKKVPPPYKDSASQHIKALAPQITTQEQMDSLVTFSREKTRKKLNLPSLWKIELGNLRNCFPDWDKEQEKTQPKQNEPEATPDPNRLVLWTRNPQAPKFSMDASAWYFYEEMTLEEAKQYDYDLYGGLPGDIQTRIKTQFDREQRGEIKRPELVA